MKNKIKITADNKIPFLKGVLEPYAEIVYLPGRTISKKDLVDTDVLIVRTRTKCNSELLDGTNVKLITTATIGFDHIDTKYCDRKNIRWVNAPGCNSTSVMQYIMSALLTIAEENNFNLKDRTLGIIGVGNVGSKVAEASKIIGMKVLLNDPPRERAEGSEGFCSLDQIKRESDIISFHVPLNKAGIDKTFHLGSEKFFTSLKDDVIIINSSRGSVIKNDELKAAIKDGKISHTVLDVWENEPEIDLELLELVDFATPHIAGYSSDGKANGTAACVNEVNEFFDLGLRSNFYPTNIPLPEGGTEIKLDCNSLAEQKIIYQIINSTYSIKNDDEIFRKSPETFEQQREEYIIRREFPCFSFCIENCSNTVKEKLHALDFKS